MAADGSGQTNISTGAIRRLTDDFEPTWSPDGQRIAFISNRDGPKPVPPEAYRVELYAVGADGSDIVRLTNNTARDTDPDWQRAPTRIAYKNAASSARLSWHSGVRSSSRATEADQTPTASASAVSRAALEAVGLPEQTLTPTPELAGYRAGDVAGDVAICCPTDPLQSVLLWPIGLLDSVEAV